MTCSRCQGEQQIVYFGIIGQGGRRGPCWCRPNERYQFLTAYQIEVAGRPKITVQPTGATT